MKTFVTGTRLAAFVCLVIAGSAFGAQSIQLSDGQTAVKLLDQNHDGLTMELQIGEVELSDVLTKDGDFTMISTAGAGPSNRYGDPALPVVSKLIQVPLGCQIRAQATAGEVVEIDLNALAMPGLVIPAQPSMSKSEDPAQVPFVYNDDTYQMTGYFNVPLVEVEEAGIMRAVRLAIIHIAPFEYSPSEHKIRVFKDVTVQVTFENPDWAATEDRYRRLYSPAFEAVYDQVINYEAPVSGDKAGLETYPIGYLIVSDGQFEAQLAPFIEWKTKKGFYVTDVYLDEIGSNNSTVAAWIETFFDTAAVAPSYLLIVADDNQLQAFSGTAGSHITDLYFCEFTGDDLPEMYYGRFSGTEPEHIQPQIDKTMEYEQLGMDPSFLGEVTLVSGVDGSYASTYGNGQINYGTNLYFDAAHGITPHVWLYPASDASGVPAAVINTVNDGTAFYNYTAHGGHTGLSDPSFSTSDLPGLTNYHKYVTIVGNCCLTNTFGDDYTSPCFGEALLRCDTTGGIGYIGASNSTYWDEDYWWGVGNGPIVANGPTYEQTTMGAYDGTFHDHGEPMSDWYVTNGAMVFAGNLGVEASTSSRKTYYWEAYHLMGDPSCMTYFGVPTANTVSHDPTILMTVSSIPVSADPGSYVGISVGGVLQGAGYVDASGSVDIPLAGFGAPCVADIVVTCQNREPYISTINVITPEGPYIVYTSNTINDAAGNGNGMIDFGESITLGLLLTNVGPDDATDVVATISTLDTFVTITDDTESYGTILGGDGSGYVADGFAFDVGGNIPDGHRVYFDLEMNGVERDTWTSQFFVTAHAPAVEIVSIAIDDSGGDNNGILDPGESANFTVTLKNNGSGQAFAVSGTLSENDQYLNLDDDYGYFGLLDSDGGVANNAGDLFTLAADAGCPLGYAVPVTLSLSGDGGFAGTLAFNVTIGDRVAFFVDDFSFDQGWTGMGTSAEWQRGSVSGNGGDPSADHTDTGDNSVLGNDIGSEGKYNNSISTTYWATSPIIDAANMSGVQMTYFHWNGCESSSYDHMYFQAFDGESWVELWSNSSTFQETEWVEEYYDLGAIADSNPDFQIRFGMGSTDGSQTYSGWNVDDIEIKGYGRIGQPALEMPTDALTDSLQPGGAVAETIKIKNAGEGTLRVWFTSEDDWLEFDGDMQTIYPADSQEFTITLNSAGQTCGDHIGSLDFTTNDNGNPEGTIPVLMHVHAPDVALSDAEITEYLETNETSVHELTISNNGPGRLDYVAGCQMFLKGDVVAKATVPVERELLGYNEADADKPGALDPFYAPTSKDFGGPDTYGHNWIDSDEAGGPTVEWIDISTTGTAVTLGDDEASTALPIGFGFPLYDSVYTELYIGSNGVLGFDDSLASRVNTALPNDDEKAFVAIFWDDFDPSKGGNIYYYHDAANDRFIVSYVNVKFYYSTTGTGDMSFQAVLYEDGTIRLNYATMDPGSRNLASGTIGIQNSEQVDALEILYNALWLHSDMAIEITAQHWLAVVPAGGSVDPYSQTIVEVRFNATELENGVYEGQVVVGCNDPDSPSQALPVTLNVGQGGPQYLCGDANNNQVGPDIEDLVYLVMYMFQEGSAPEVMESVDVNGNLTGPDIEDLVYLVMYMFQDGPELNCPQ